MSTIQGVRSEPCSACPYRRDVAPGVWAASEYAKLPPYDAETASQPFAPFMCHSSTDHLCSGWAHVGGWDLIALRLTAARGVPVDLERVPSTPLFDTHTEAAEHGLSGLTTPPTDVIERLIRKHPRLMPKGE